MWIIEKLRQILIKNKNKEVINYIKSRGTSYSSASTKSVISSTETLTFNTKAQKMIEKVKNDVTDIEKAANGDAEYLLKYIEDNGTKVYRIKKASSLLDKINEHTGFICSLEGSKAFYINALLKEGVSSKTEPLFIIDSEVEIDYYMLLREFYLWYSFKTGLSGFEFEAQEKLKAYINNKKFNISALKYDEMCRLKEAISRDNEANDFVMSILRHREGGKNVINKMKNGGADI